MKNPFLSEEFLKTQVITTPEEIGDAISAAIDRHVARVPKEIRGKFADMYAHFGATFMTELLAIRHGLDPLKGLENPDEEKSDEEKPDEATQSEKVEVQEDDVNKA